MTEEQQEEYDKQVSHMKKGCLARRIVHVFFDKSITQFIGVSPEYLAENGSPLQHKPKKGKKAKPMKYISTHMIH